MKVFGQRFCKIVDYLIKLAYKYDTYAILTWSEKGGKDRNVAEEGMTSPYIS